MRILLPLHEEAISLWITVMGLSKHNDEAALMQSVLFHSMCALRPFGEFIVANVLHVPGTVYDLTSHTLLPNAIAIATISDG